MQIDQDAEEALWTEEDLKAKVILPWLTSMGIVGPSDLTLEHVHHVRIGRHIVSLRHDFLVLTNGHPLIFIEAKRVNHQLTDDDRRQAWLYALLNDPMAPLAMLTNGKDTEVYDTLTNRRVDGAVVEIARPYFQEGFVFDPGFELRLRTDALARFVSLSPENLRRFSSAQQRYRASHLLGNGDELGRKIIPELYVPSASMAESRRAFLESGEPTYVILGEAGIGKTNCIWAFAQEYGVERLALFFDAGRLGKGIWNALCDDFNWAFSTNQPEEQLVRDLQQIANEASTQLLVFIDAIDENSDDGFVLEVDEFCRRLADHGARTVIACRQWDWQRFKRVRDNPTWIGENARVEMIPQFSSEELSQAWPRYSSLFQVTGNLTLSVARECCDRFTLRAVCEVFAGRTVPDSLDVPELVGEFVKRRLAKSSDRATLEACAVTLARHLYQNGTQTSAGDELLSLPAWTPASRDQLLSAGILAQTSGENYRFSDGPVQDFMVAVKANHWDRVSVGDFDRVADAALASAVGQQALAWFIRHREGYRQVVEQSVVGRALSYVMRRRELVNRWVPGIRSALVPYCDGDIELHLLTQDGRFTGGWSLEPRDEPDSPPVVFAEFNGKRGEWRLHGIPDARQAGLDLANEISTLLERGASRSTRLRVGVPFLHSRIVLDELVFAAAAPWATQLHLSNVRRETGSIFSGSFTRQELQDGLRTWCAYWYAEREFVQRQIDRGIWKVATNNDGVSTVSSTLSNADRAEICAAADQTLASDHSIPIPNVSGDVPPVHLFLTLLRHTNTDEFTNLLPSPDVDLPNGGLLEDCYSDSLKREFLQSFFDNAVASLGEAARGLLGPIVQEYRPWLEGPLTLVWDLKSRPSLMGKSVVTYALGSASGSVNIAVKSLGDIRMFSDENVRGIDDTNLKPIHVTEMSFSSLLASTRNRAATPIFDWVLHEVGMILPEDLFLTAFSAG